MPRDEQVDLPAVEGFEIKRRLGVGGMSVVYEAKNLGLDELLAIKVVSPEAMGKIGVQRFRLESVRLAALKHPNIVRVSNAGFTKDGKPYIAMELLKGRTLADAFAAKDLPPARSNSLPFLVTASWRSCTSI